MGRGRPAGGGLGLPLGPAVPLGGGVQRKVAVGPVNDVFEDEADRAARRVASGQAVPRISRMPLSGPAGAAGLPDEIARRQPAAVEEDERSAKAQRVSSGGPPADPVAIAARAIETAGPGRPLAPAVRSRLESAFGENLSRVRVHDSPADREAAAGIQARAFTYGSDVWLGPDESADDLSLMAHEVAHVLQQGEGRGAGFLQRSPQAGSGARGRAPAQTPGRALPEAQAESGEEGRRQDESTGVLQGDVITFSAIEVPAFKLSDHREERYAGELIRNRNYSKESRQSARQRDVWQADLAKQTDRAETILREKLKQAYGGPPAGNFHVFKAPSKKSKSEPVYFVGDLRTIAASLVLPSWDKAGQPHSFDVDHILELQLGNWPDDPRANDIKNMELLDSSVNRSSGSVIRSKIDEKVKSFIRASGGEFGREPAAVKRSYHLKFRRAVKVREGKQPGPNDYWTREEIAKGAHLGPVEPANLADVGGDGKVAVFPSPRGGKPMELSLRGAEGSEAAATRGERHLLPPFVVKAKRFVTAGEDAPSQAEFGVLKVNVKENDPKWQPFPADEEIRIQRLPGARYAGYIEKGSVLSRLRNLRLKRLSPVRIDECEVLPEGGVYATGAILPEVPLISGIDLGFELTGDDLSVFKTFRAEELKVPQPFEVQGSTLVVSISSERGFAVEGQVDFAVDKVGEGYLRAAAERGGLTLQGTFTFDTDLFEQADVDVWYRDGAFGARGTLAIDPGKVRGVRSGRAAVEYASDRFSAEGEVVPDIPGIGEGRMALSFSETEGLLIGGGFKLAPGIPGVESGSIDVTLRKTEEGWKVSAEGSAKPAVPGIDVTLRASYNDGLFTLHGSAAYERGMVRGRVEFGVTNRPVGENGVPAGEPGRELRAFGGGTATVRFSPWLQGTAGLRVLETGEVKVVGEIGFPQALPLFKDYRFKKSILETPPLDIPIIGVAAAGRRIGIFATVKGGIKAEATIGPGVLEDVLLHAEYSPEREDEAQVRGTARLDVPAFAGLRLYVKGGIGAGIPIVDAEAGLEVGGQLGLHGALSVEVNVDWTPARGLVIDSAGEIFVEPRFVFDIDAYVDVELDFYLESITLYEKRWKLAAVEFGSGVRFGLRFPVHYEEDRPFNISLSDVEFIVPDIDVKALITGLVERIV